jgi:hypothetical protein
VTGSTIKNLRRPADTSAGSTADVSADGPWQADGVSSAQLEALGEARDRGRVIRGGEGRGRSRRRFGTPQLWLHLHHGSGFGDGVPDQPPLDDGGHVLRAVLAQRWRGGTDFAARSAETVARTHETLGFDR